MKRAVSMTKDKNHCFPHLIINVCICNEIAKCKGHGVARVNAPIVHTKSSPTKGFWEIVWDQTRGKRSKTRLSRKNEAQTKLLSSWTCPDHKYIVRSPKNIGPGSHHHNAIFFIQFYRTMKERWLPKTKSKSKYKKFPIGIDESTEHSTSWPKYDSNPQ